MTLKKGRRSYTSQHEAGGKPLREGSTKHRGRELKEEERNKESLVCTFLGLYLSDLCLFRLCENKKN